MFRRLTALVCLALPVVVGCGGAPLVLEDFTGPADETRLLVDLTMQVERSSLRELSGVDVGGPGWNQAAVSGWSRPETDIVSGRPMAWVDADTAVLELFILDVAFDRLDIRGRTMNWDGSPEQQMTVSINARRLGSTPLDPHMSDISLPIPPDTLRIGGNRIELRFEWTARPMDHVPGNQDRRTLAAAFQSFALTDADTAAESAIAAAPVADADRLTVPPGAALRVAVPLESDAFVEFRAVEFAGTGSNELWAWLEQPGGAVSPVRALGPTGVHAPPIRMAIPPDGGEPINLVLAVPRSSGPVTIVRPQIRGPIDGDHEVPSIVLVVVDTLRADYLASYGAEVETPVTDELAARGVRFSNARAHIPITGPSHSSLFTSLLPMEHGVVNNAQELRGGFPSMPDELRTDGRRTAAVVSLGVLKRDYGFDRGFDDYNDEFRRDWIKDAVEVTSEALELADGLLDGPFFLWAHYSDPHEPYAPLDRVYPEFELRLAGESVGTIDAGGRVSWFEVTVPPGDSVFEVLPLEFDPERIFRLDNFDFSEPNLSLEPVDGWRVINRRMGRTTLESSFPATLRLTNPTDDPVTSKFLITCKELLSIPEIREAYAREVEIVDREIGRLLWGLEERGMMHGTLVVFVSDHGEGLGDHNHVGHISQIYDSLLDVPLIFSWPGRLAEGVVIDSPVSLVDVYPTIAELLSLAGPEVSSGASLVPLMRGEDVPDRAIITATYRPESYSDKRGIVVDGFKYIHSWKDDEEKEELYNVVDDPRELEDLSDTHPEILERLRRDLAARLAAMATSESVDVELSDEDRAHLRALGYIH
jgi:arylsulfatase A-like enzyme